jgi:serralysin
MMKMRIREESASGVFMAQLSGGSTAPIRMDQLDAATMIQGDPIEKSTITLALDKSGGRTLTLRGNAFTYDDFDKLRGGTLFTLDISGGGESFLNVTGLTTHLGFFTKALRDSGNTAALDILFGEDDGMRGTSLDDFLNGYAGHDNLFGGDGADTLLGGAGNDHIYGQSAGGGADGADSISAEGGDDYLQGNAGNDTLDGGAGSDRIQGGQGSDNLRGAAGNDVINGNLGNDTLDGGDGNDSLRGGQGNDSLTGGVGNDTLSGDLGSDNLRGGAGADVFIFTGDGALFGSGTTDVIADFASGDRIDLSFSVAAALSGSRQSTFARAMTEAQELFEERSGNGEVAAVAVGTDTYVFFASDGGGTVDSAIRLTGVNVTAIDGADFI